ncbi:MAG: hypothetical protein RL154_85 [Pseudomonadota bacterium]|jgi:phosphoribosylformylglycinamidine synthase
MKAIVNIYLKEGVLDPQGKAVAHALDSLGFTGINEVRVGKQIVIDITSKSKKDADIEVKKMCEELLANTVIENYDYSLVS